MYYVLARVGHQTYVTPLGKRKFRTIHTALAFVATVIDAENDHWRVIEVPNGEPTDYDGAVVAEIETGRLW